MLYYIENLIDLNTNTLIKLNSQSVIRSATVNEQLRIKNIISKFGMASGYQPRLFRHHESYVKEILPSGGISFGSRKKDDYRYFVLDDKEDSDIIYNENYEKSFLLIDNELFIPFAFSRLSNPIGGCSIRYSFDSEFITYTYFNEKNTILGNKKAENIKTFKEKDRLQLLEIYTLLNDFKQKEKKYPNINKAITDFYSTGEITNQSVFKIVSYFACLELLLVDNNFDKRKAIRLQLETKLDLINNRFKEPILVSNYIKGPDTLTLGKIIGISYNYRSSIAHGDFIDFEKKLEVLSRISMIDFLMFLRVVLKKTLIFALEEPQLITDLKKC
jgi:hypothetical protein